MIYDPYTQTQTKFLRSDPTGRVTRLERTRPSSLIDWMRCLGMVAAAVALLAVCAYLRLMPA